MHDFSSADGGEFFTGRGKRRFDDDVPTSVKRVRRQSLPPVEAIDATDGLPEGGRWSIWDQTETLVPNDIDSPYYGSGDDHMTCADRRVVRDCCALRTGELQDRRHDAPDPWLLAIRDFLA